MVSLVEDMDSIPNIKVTNTVAIQHLYAFALNRRNQPGDRNKALVVLEKVIFYECLMVNCLVYAKRWCVCQMRP